MLESRGIPVATITSQAFAPLGQRVAKGVGFNAFPLALIPHPMDFKTRPELEEIADSIVGDIVHILTTDSRQLAEEFEDKYAGRRMPVRSATPI